MNWVVEIAVGEFILDRGLDLPSNFTLKGAGIFATTLELANARSAGMNVVQGKSTGPQSNISISDMRIDGNRSRQTDGGHGIRLGSFATDDIRIDGVSVEGVGDYGIGFQAASFTRIWITDVRIRKTGFEGIDFKNTGNTNLDITLSNASVSKFARDERTAPGVDQGLSSIFD